MDSDERVTLYNPADGVSISSGSRAEQVRLRAAGYTEERPFRPDEHTVDEVERHLAEHPDDAARVVAAEQAGRGRKTIVAAGPGENAGETQPDD